MATTSRPLLRIHAPAAFEHPCSAQLTYLLFLKMADERTKAPYNQKSPVPEIDWP